MRETSGFVMNRGIASVVRYLKFVDQFDIHHAAGVDVKRSPGNGLVIRRHPADGFLPVANNPQFRDRHIHPMGQLTIPGFHALRLAKRWRSRGVPLVDGAPRQLRRCGRRLARCDDGGRGRSCRQREDGAGSPANPFL